MRSSRVQAQQQNTQLTNHDTSDSNDPYTTSSAASWTKDCNVCFRLGAISKGSPLDMAAMCAVTRESKNVSISAVAALSAALEHHELLDGK